MATQILYNYNPITPVLISREEHVNFGAISAQLGDAARGFKGGTDFEIWTAAVGGTQLVEDTDYELLNIDDRNSPDAGFDIYTRLRIITPAYQTGSIYVTYKVVLSYVDAVFYNDLYNLAISAGATTPKYITNADSPYTITDFEAFKYICDSSGGNIILNLPTLADNQNREIEIIHQTGGNLLTIDGESTETIDGLLTIELPKEKDRLKIIGTTSEWGILDEKISCQLSLDTYAGYGSTDNKIMQLTNVSANYGNMFSENHTTGYNAGTEGIEISINKSGIFSFTSIGRANTGGGQYGFSLNSSQLTTGIININQRDAKAYTSPVNAGYYTYNWEGHLEKNDIFRLHTSGLVSATVGTIEFTAVYIRG